MKKSNNDIGMFIDIVNERRKKEALAGKHQAS